MPVSLVCPNMACARATLAPDSVAGKRVKCPGCGQPITVAPGSTTTVARPSTIDPAGETARPTTTTVTPAEAMKQVGRFVVRGKLGEGAFGAVYRAYDPQLDREVALKVPHAAVLDSPKRVERFLREAKAAANLRHPHIVPVFDAGTDHGQHYIASAFINGQKLADAVEASDGGLEFDRAARLVRELAEALAYAHGEGVVHRDVKPDNVMLDAQDRVHLMDFGLAFRQDEGAKLTNDGAVMGTPSYMAPEQAKGDTAAVGPASDQYACGVVLYELLTGKVPFGGPVPVVMHHQIHTDPEPPKKFRRAIPKDLETVCLKALRKNPAERYANCRSLADDIRRWQEGEPVSARRVGPVEQAARWARKNAGVVIGVAAVLFMLLAGGAAVAVFAQQASIDRLKAEEALRQKAESDASAKDAADEVSGALGTAAEEREKAIQFKKKADKAEAECRLAQALAGQAKTAADASKGDLEQAKREAAAAKLEADKLKAEAMQEVEKAKQEVEKAKQEADALKAKMIANHGRVPLVVIRGHTGRITSAAFNADGTQIVTGGEDRAVKVWDATTGKELYSLPGHSDVVNSIACSPDGALIVTGSRSGTAVVWDGETRKAVSSLIGHTTEVQTVAFSADGRLVVTASGDKTAKVWNAKTGKEVLTFRDHSKRVNSARFTADGKWVLSASDDKTAKVWDARTGKEVFALTDIKDEVKGADISPDGFHIVTATTTDAPVLWHRLGRKVVKRLGARGEAASCVAISADGRRIVTASPDASVTVCDAWTGDNLFTVTGLSKRPATPSFHPDGSRVLLSLSEDAVAVWGVTTGADGKPLPNNTDLTPGTILFRSKKPEGGMNIVSLYLDGSCFVGKSGSDGSASVWHTNSGLELLELGSTRGYRLFSCFNADGSRILNVTDRDARVCETISGKSLFTLTGQTGYISAAAFSPDGTRIVTTGDDRKKADWTARVWDATTGKRLSIFAHEGNVRAATFSPDGKQIYTVSDRTANEGELIRWEVASQAAEKTVGIGRAAKGAAITFSPDGTLIALLLDGELDFRTARDPSRPYAYSGRATGTFSARSFNPDSTLFVAGGKDQQTVSVWEVSSGKIVDTLVGHGSTIQSAQFSADGKYIVSAAEAGEVIVWVAPLRPDPNKLKPVENTPRKRETDR